MIRHRFKPIASIELHGSRLGIHHKSNATDIVSDAGNAINGIKQQVLTDALSFTSAAAFKGLTARARLMAGIEAFLDYWEREPENFQLVFMSSTTVDPKLKELSLLALQSRFG